MSGVNEIIRRLTFTEAEIKILIGLTAGFDGEVIQKLHQLFIETKEQNEDPEYQRIAKAYRDAVDGQEMPIDPDAVVSRSDEGAYVSSWVWVSNDDAQLCYSCFAHLHGAGDGFDGECPECADKSFKAENGDPDDPDGLAGPVTKKWLTFVDYSDGNDSESWSPFYIDVYTSDTEEEAEWIGAYQVAHHQNNVLIEDGLLGWLGEYYVREES